MALLNHSAGNGAAPGSAARTVPAPQAAPHQSGPAAASQCDLLRQAGSGLTSIGSLLDAIAYLAENLIVGASEPGVSNLCEAIGACVDKAQRGVDQVEETLNALRPAIDVQEGGAQ